MKYLIALCLIATLAGCPKESVEATFPEEPPATAKFHSVSLGISLTRTIDLETGIVCYHTGHSGGINCFQFEEAFEPSATPNSNHL